MLSFRIFSFSFFRFSAVKIYASACECNDVRIVKRAHFSRALAFNPDTRFKAATADVVMRCIFFRFFFLSFAKMLHDFMQKLVRFIHFSAKFNFFTGFWSPNQFNLYSFLRSLIVFLLAASWSELIDLTPSAQL